MLGKRIYACLSVAVLLALVILIVACSPAVNIVTITKREHILGLSQEVNRDPVQPSFSLANGHLARVDEGRGPAGGVSIEGFPRGRKLSVTVPGFISWFAPGKGRDILVYSTNQRDGMGGRYYTRVDTSTGHLKTVPAQLTRLQATALAFSPRDDRVLLWGVKGKEPAILMANGDGRHLVSVQTPSSQDKGPATWSPNGRQVAYEIVVGDPDKPEDYMNSEIWITDLRTGKYRRLIATGDTASDEGFYNPIWAPIGRLIAVEEKKFFPDGPGREHPGWRVVVVDSETGRYQPVTGWGNFHPHAWSESGDALYYLSGQQIGKTNMQVMKVGIRQVRP